MRSRPFLGITCAALFVASSAIFQNAALAGTASIAIDRVGGRRVTSGEVSGQLRGMAKDATGYGLSAQYLAVYTLAIAGQPEPAYHDLLFQKRAKLSAEDRALVALAVIESKGPKAMIDELLRAPVSSDAYIDQFFKVLIEAGASDYIAKPVDGATTSGVT